ncbi:hypothetical protein PR048_028773 [Dryococelus australis]|uniref:Uncharacterized protein n=1 Tax=Dryococelus australis TaxID=614101 RepID=A0ABQ9GBH4_9NEOP|nr:hypothetical protein PR048_028773 [Dryococelus australis]
MYSAGNSSHFICNVPDGVLRQSLTERAVACCKEPPQHLLEIIRKRNQDGRTRIHPPPSRMRVRCATTLPRCQVGVLLCSRFHFTIWQHPEIRRPVHNQVMTFGRFLLASAAVSIRFTFWPRWCSSLTTRLPPRRKGFDFRRGRSRFSHVGIVQDDAVGWWVSSGVSRFSRPCVPAPLHTSSPSSVLKTSSLKSLLYLDPNPARLGLPGVTDRRRREAAWSEGSSRRDVSAGRIGGSCHGSSIPTPSSTTPVTTECRRFVSLLTPPPPFSSLGRRRITRKPLKTTAVKCNERDGVCQRRCYRGSSSWSAVSPKSALLRWERLTSLADANALSGDASVNLLQSPIHAEVKGTMPTGWQLRNGRQEEERYMTQRGRFKKLSLRAACKVPSVVYVMAGKGHARALVELQAMGWGGRGGVIHEICINDTSGRKNTCGNRLLVRSGPSPGLQRGPARTRVSICLTFPNRIRSLFAPPRPPPPDTLGLTWSIFSSPTWRATAYPTQGTIFRVPRRLTLLSSCWTARAIGKSEFILGEIGLAGAEVAWNGETNNFSLKMKHLTPRASVAEHPTSTCGFKLESATPLCSAVAI